MPGARTPFVARMRWPKNSPSGKLSATMNSSDGEVIEVDPPRKLVQTWRMLMTPDLAAEGFTRLTYELEEVRGGVTRLTVTHDASNAPMFAAVAAGEREHEGAGGGWNEILSGLKTLLETGQQLPFQSGQPREG
jgi:uncharacterized protein YndB with AHSA1/START domain